MKFYILILKFKSIDELAAEIERIDARIERFNVNFEVIKFYRKFLFEILKL